MIKKAFLITSLAVAAFALSACEEDTQRKGERKQEEVMQRASNSVPVPEVTQFTTRETVARWVEHANEPDQTHYVYVMLPGVGFVGYYVADSAPVNICTTLTPPERVGNFGGSKRVLKSPALDGVYYSGSSCSKWYFFDAASGEKIEVGGQMAFFVLSMPLVIDAPRLEVKVSDDSEENSD